MKASMQVSHNFTFYNHLLYTYTFIAANYLVGTWIERFMCATKEVTVYLEFYNNNKK